MGNMGQSITVAEDSSTANGSLHMDRLAKHIIFKGHVQGVGFRYTTHRIARRYEVTGYVRNLPDKTVEAVIQGPTGDVEACLADIRDSFGSYIREAKIEPIPPNPHYIDFQITF